MKQKIIMLATFLVVLAGCKSEQKDYEAAMKSTNINELQAYIDNYPDAPDKNIDNVMARIEELYADSAAFALIQGTSDIVERYNYATSYIDAYPNGLHVNEIQAIIEADKAEAERIMEERAEEYAKEQAAQEWQKRYGTTAERVRNRIFKSEEYMTSLVLTIPDQNGKGRIGVINMWYPTELSKVYTYEVYDSNELHCREMGANTIHILKLYDDDLYFEMNANDVEHKRFMLTPEVYEKNTKIINSAK